MNFGLALARKRTQAGLSQSKLAELADYDHSYVSRLESGTRFPTQEAIRRLGKAMELGLGEMADLYNAAGYLSQEPGGVAKPLSMGLAYLVEAERRVNFNRPQDLSGSKEALATYATALTVELGELLQELDWKPWKTRTTPIDKAKVLDEFADVLAFIGVVLANICAQTGLTPEEFGDAFDAKTEVNIKRAQGLIRGYVPANGTKVTP